jgi:PAS domain S-box-containing protein
MGGEQVRAPARSWLLVVCLAALAVVVGGLGFWAWRVQADGLEQAAKTTLASTADTTSHEIRLWLDERLGDVRALTGNPLFTTAMAARIEGRDSVAFRRGVQPLLARMQRSHGYPTITLVDPSETPVWGLPARLTALDGVTAALVRRVQSAGTPLISNLYLTSLGHPGMVMAAPVFTAPSDPRSYIGAVVFAIDPDRDLYRLLTARPGTSDSTETILIEQRGSRVVYLSESRYHGHKALVFSLPVSTPTPGLAAAAALDGSPAVSTGTDCHGVAVWFTGRRVSGTSWSVLAKVDAGEVLEPARERGWLIGGLTVAIVLLAGAAFMMFWRLREARARDDLRRGELERLALVRRYDLLAKYANDVIVLFDAARMVIAVNERACEVYGYTRDELLGLELGDLLAPSQEELSQERWAQTAASGGVTFESVHRRKDGSEFPIEVSARPVDVEGVRFIHVIGRDITERKNAETALLESERRYRFLTESVSDVIWVLDLDAGRFTYVSPSVQSLTGYSPAEAMTGTMADTLVPSSLEKLTAALPDRMAAFREGADTVYVDEIEQPCRDGTTVWTETTTRFILNAETGHVDVLGVSRDIGVRRRAQEESRVVVEFLGLINESRGTGELICNTVSFVRKRSGCEAVGVRLRDGDDYPYFEATGFPTGCLAAENRLCEQATDGEVMLDDEFRPYPECMCREVISGRFDAARPFFTEYGSFWSGNTTELFAATTEAERQTRSRNRCNGEGYESVALIPLRVGNEPLGLLQLNDRRPGVHSETSVALWERLARHLAVALAKLRAEEALHENTERLLRAQSLAHIGDWDWEIAGGQVTWSDEVYKIYGVDPSFVTTFETIMPLVHEDDRQGVIDTVERMMRDLDTTELEFRIVRPSGEIRHLRQTVTVERNMDGQAVRAFGIHQDITERRADEEQIRILNAELEQRVEDRTGQLEAANKELEAFSYSVSHDLRSPLRAIDGFSLALLEDCGEVLDATGRDYLGRVRAASQRMGLLIDDLLRLSRVSRDSMTPRRIDLSKLARAAIADLRANEPERAVEVLIEPHVLCTADRRLLGIALDNLLGNAWKFTAGIPDARIEFGVIDYDGAPPAYFVRDNGAGFDDTYAGTLFQPFQRLHRSDEYPGTGIGLAIVNRVVARHGGRVWAEGEVGGGAAFYFTLGGAAVSDR